MKISKQKLIQALEKEKTELRIYSTIERLRHDFDRLVRSDFLQDKYDAKIISYKEIYIPGVYRMVFTLDDERKIRGYRADKVFIDEMVSNKTSDYLEAISIVNSMKGEDVRKDKDEE